MQDLPKSEGIIKYMGHLPLFFLLIERFPDVFQAFEVSGRLWPADRQYRLPWGDKMRDWERELTPLIFSITI